MKLSYIYLLFFSLLINFPTFASGDHGASSEHDEHEEEQEEGPHHGRVLRSDDFALELKIFENGVAPEYRVWVTDKEQSVSPKSRIGNQTKPLGWHNRSYSL